MERTITRVRAEYLEMPGMRLTQRQMERLCGISPQHTDEILTRLLKEKFLRRHPDGTFGRRHES